MKKFISSFLFFEKGHDENNQTSNCMFDLFLSWSIQ